jgi:tRNA(Ile)-lysidine synthase
MTASSPPPIPPLGAEEFSLLMRPFAPFPPKIALAVSGGPDSMALAYCVKRWSQRDCVAFIVEHGLRPESPLEAAQVKQRLQSLGIATEILPWNHDPVSKRLHETAREARYALLTEACRRHGATDLLLAHHSGDQAETILMRLAKGSGIDGLAGIAAQNMRDGIRLVRPFLPLPKERLIATCEAAPLAYVTDPSNASEKYARGRLRRIMPLLAAEGLTIERLTTLGLRAREAKEALDSATQEFLKTSAQTGQGGTLCLDRSALRAAPRAISLRALAASLRYVCDDAYPPEHAALSGLLDAIVISLGEHARTLYGCIASISENRVMLLREPSAAREVLPLLPGATVLWDGRWLVTSSPSNPSATIRALGLPPHEAIDALAPRLRHEIPQGRVRASLPAVWEGDSLRAIPSFDQDSTFRMVYKKQGSPA